MKKKFPIVRIEFDDHAKSIGGEADFVRCVVWGILFKETKKAYYVSTWMSDGELNGENSDTYCVLKMPDVKCKTIKYESL